MNVFSEDAVMPCFRCSAEYLCLQISLVAGTRNHRWLRMMSSLAGLNSISSEDDAGPFTRLVEQRIPRLVA